MAIRGKYLCQNVVSRLSLLSFITTQQMFERQIVFNTNQFILYKFHNILLDLSIVDLYLLLHRILAIFIKEAADFGDRLVGFDFYLYHAIWDKRNPIVHYSRPFIYNNIYVKTFQSIIFVKSLFNDYISRNIFIIFVRFI